MVRAPVTVTVPFCVACRIVVPTQFAGPAGWPAISVISVLWTVTSNFNHRCRFYKGTVMGTLTEIGGFQSTWGNLGSETYLSVDGSFSPPSNPSDPSSPTGTLTITFTPYPARPRNDFFVYSVLLVPGVTPFPYTALTYNGAAGSEAVTLLEPYTGIGRTVWYR